MLPPMLVAHRKMDQRVESRGPTPPPAPPRPAYLTTPLIAALMLVVTLVAGSHYGIGLRDPTG